MSGLDGIHEKAHMKQGTDGSSWRCLNPSSAGSSRDDEKKDGAFAPGTNSDKRKRPPARVYPEPRFDLRRVVGPKGRASYEHRQKLQVLEFSRLVCVDGQPVGNRGAATVFGIEPKLLRNWGSQEAVLRRSLGMDGSYPAAAAAGARSLHPGRAASTKEVEHVFDVVCLPAR